MSPSRWKAIAAAMKARPASQGWKTRRNQLFSDSPNKITKKPSASGTKKMKLRLMMAQKASASCFVFGSNSSRQTSP